MSFGKKRIRGPAGLPHFHGRRNDRCLHLVFDRTCTASKREHSNSSVLRVVPSGFRNSDILFFGSVRVAVVVHCSTISVTKLVY